MYQTKTNCLHLPWPGWWCYEYSHLCSLSWCAM